MSLSPKERAALNQWLDQNRGRPQFRPPPTAGAAVNRLIRPMSKKYGGGSSARSLMEFWPQIIGERWAKISTPERFIGGRDGRTLVIAAPGAAGSLIMAASGQIIDRLNAHLGDGTVHKLKIIQKKMKQSKPRNAASRGLTPGEESELQEGLSKVGNKRLKDALENLGRNVLSRD